MKKAAASNAKSAAKPRKAANTHPLSKPLPEGTVLNDHMKGQWKIGKSIGSGGFGLIYLAQQNNSSTVPDNAQYVIKVEPFANGPLFCELAFYIRAAKPDAIRQWMTSHHLKSLGMPKFIASGNHEHNGEKHRFMVMERFGTDLQKLFEASGKRFQTHTVFVLGLKLMNTLEYLHESEYVHADIKASNLLMGYNDPQEVYLVDYGLAFRYITEGVHKLYKEDPKRAHDGTVEFTSRDAHLGVLPSRRGDLEILGYCMVQWLCGQLPWEDNLENKNYVRDQKRKYMSDIPGFMKKCFTDSENIPVSELSQYLQYVAGLEYTQRPDYDHCRTIFTNALRTLGCKKHDQLDFKSPSSRATTAAATARKEALSPALQPKPKVQRGKKRTAAAVIDDSPSEDEDDEYPTPSPPKLAKRAVESTRTRGSPMAAARSSSAVLARSSPLAATRSSAVASKSPAAVVSKGAKSRTSLGKTPTGSQSQTGKPRVTKQRRVPKRRPVTVSISTQTTPGLNK